MIDESAAVAVEQRILHAIGAGAQLLVGGGRLGAQIERVRDAVRPETRGELTPFGGIGDSGLGVKEGVRESICALTVGKLVSFPWR